MAQPLANPGTRLHSTLPLMRIRQATLADARRIQRIVTAELLIDVPDFHWHTSAEITRAIRNDEYFVAVLKGRITGILCLRQDTDALWIETIAVARQHQRKGQGRALVRFAVERAGKLGLPWVRVSMPSASRSRSPRLSAATILNCLRV